MAQPIRPAGRAVYGQAHTTFMLSITYAGPLDTCVELYKEAAQVPLSFRLSSATDEGLTEVTVSAQDAIDQISTGAALEHLAAVHRRAEDLGLAHSRHDNS